MRENEATLGRLQQQGAGMPSEERERERERERWSLLRAARDEADRSLSLAASLADKEAALSHAHATIKEVRLPHIYTKYCTRDSRVDLMSERSLVEQFLKIVPSRRSTNTKREFMESNRKFVFRPSDLNISKRIFYE